jgi:biopolymer transport protein ExbD
MTPLLDVIFLLLTFFILVQPLMVRAELLRVTLEKLESGAPASEAPMLAITIDAAGRMYVNREPVDERVLRRRLGEAAAADPAPRVYLGVEAGPGEVDRLPTMWRIVELLDDAGITDFSFIGAPREPTNGTGD